MNQAERKHCLEITQKLMEMPAAQSFAKPIDHIASGLPNYYKIIDDPQDFSSIEERLKKREYRSIREWKRDMNLVWQNCYTYYGPESYPSVLARYLQDKFEKYLKTFSLLKPEGWLEKVFNLREEFNLLSSNVPKKFNDKAPLEMKERKNMKPFSPSDYVYLFKSIATLPNPKDREYLKAMLQNPKDEIALTNLSLSTLTAANAFVKAHLPEHHLSI